MNGGDASGVMVAQYIRRHHRHEAGERQCTSAVIKHVKAPVHLVCARHPPLLCIVSFACFLMGAVWTSLGRVLAVNRQLLLSLSFCSVFIHLQSLCWFLQRVRFPELASSSFDGPIEKFRMGSFPNAKFFFF